MVSNEAFLFCVAGFVLFVDLFGLGDCVWVKTQTKKFFQDLFLLRLLLKKNIPQSPIAIGRKFYFSFF